MSLATRCTSCATVFRVVQDQLKVSEGWVRCGRCGTVFNALDVLFDLNQGNVTPPQPPSQTPVPRKPDDQKNRSFDRNKESSGPPRKKEAEPGPQSNRRRSDFASTLFSPRSEGLKDLANARSAVALEAFKKAKPSPQRKLLPGSYEVDKTIIAGTESITDDGDNGHQPATLEFVRLADQKAKWAHPHVQRIVALSIAMLLLTLFIQVVHHFRDITAAKWPETASLLLRWCQLLNCQLQAPRHIENVVVESVAMTRSHSSSNKFLLSVVLQNRNSFAVAMPALDLTLRDTNGVLITRRMLKPEDLQLKTVTIEPRSEAQVQVVLTEKDQRIVNYTVEAFYP